MKKVNIYVEKNYMFSLLYEDSQKEPIVYQVYKAQVQLQERKYLRLSNQIFKVRIKLYVNLFHNYYFKFYFRKVILLYFYEITYG